MARSHTPLSVWFWSAYLVSSQTPGVSAVQLRRQLGLSRYETAFQILHKLRAGMVRPDQDRIGGRPGEHVEVDETWAGGRTRGKGRGVHDKVLVASAVEVRQRKPGTKLERNKLLRAKIKQASSRLGTICQPPLASEADLTDLALRMCEWHGIAPRVTAALAIEARPRREGW